MYFVTLAYDIFTDEEEKFSIASPFASLSFLLTVNTVSFSQCSSGNSFFDFAWLTDADSDMAETLHWIVTEGSKEFETVAIIPKFYRTCPVSYFGLGVQRALDNEFAAVFDDIDSPTSNPSPDDLQILQHL